VKAVQRNELLERIIKDALDVAMAYKIDGDDDLAGYWFDVAADARKCSSK
jgi:hypothetical protein